MTNTAKRESDAELIRRLGCGNENAISVMCALATIGMRNVLDAIEDCGLVGNEIWIAYRYACKGSLDKFAKRALAQDMNLLRAANVVVELRPEKMKG